MFALLVYVVQVTLLQCSMCIAAGCVPHTKTVRLPFFFIGEMGCLVVGGGGGLWRREGNVNTVNVCCEHKGKAYMKRTLEVVS